MDRVSELSEIFTHTHSRAKFSVARLARRFGKSITRNKLHSILWSAARCENKQLFAAPWKICFATERERDRSINCARERERKGERTHIVCSIFSQFSIGRKKVFSECKQLGACELTAGAGGASIIACSQIVAAAAEVISKMCTRREVSLLLSTPAEMDLTK